MRQTRCLATLVALSALAAGCNALLDIQDRPPRADDAGEAGAPPSGSGYRAAVMQDGPILYLRFGEDGGTTAGDEVDGGPSGIYPSAGVTFGVPGALEDDTNTAIELDGTSTIQVPRSADFSGLSPFSVEVWLDAVDASAEPAYAFALDHERSTGRGGWDVVVSPVNGSPGSVTIVFERYADATTNVSVASNPAAAGVYHHVVGTFDVQMNEHIYVDGLLALSAVANIDIPAVPGPWSIGAQNCPCTMSGFVGRLDELAIYGVALSADQVKAHFDAATTP
jgi:hypothetical protein